MLPYFLAPFTLATTLGLNVSVFLDFNIETVGDVLSLLFSIDDSVNLSLAETPDQKVALTFDNPTMQDFFKKWCQFKNVYEKEKAEILTIEDEDKRQAELDKLNATQEEWKLRAIITVGGSPSAEGCRVPVALVLQRPK